MADGANLVLNAFNTAPATHNEGVVRCDHSNNINTLRLEGIDVLDEPG